MQHEQHRVPVTALAFWRHDILLAGEGTALNAYNIQTQSLGPSTNVFSEQAIHGIATGERSDDSTVLTWGGRYLRPVELSQWSTNLVRLRPGRLCEGKDWILDVALCPFSADTSRLAAIVTAHNSLAIWDDPTQGSQQVLHSIVSGSNCILYAAHITWLCASKCLIASGTAFGDVIVWSCVIHQKGRELSGQSQTHYTFSAHEGSVYGVRLSTPSFASAIGGRRQLLATCSDDRNMKLWDISEEAAESLGPDSLNRETGFVTKLSQDKYASVCLSQVTAHISRVWQLRFLEFPGVYGDEQYDSAKIDGCQHRILSFGEDASCITWSLEAVQDHRDSLRYTFKQLHVQRAHSGKNIWSVAIDSSRYIATGGADGGISLSSLAHLSSPESPTEIDRNLLPENTTSDNFKAYDFVNQDELVVTTNHGKVILLAFNDNRAQNSVQISPNIEGLRGYSVVSAGTLGVSVVAGRDGTVYAYLHKAAQLTEILQTRGKVAGLFMHALADSSGDASDVVITLLATNVIATTASFSTFLIQNDTGRSGSVANLTISELQLPASFIITSFACRSVRRETWVVLGSRTGSIAIYYNSLCNGKQPYQCVLLCHGVHGKEAMTSLKFEQGKQVLDGNATIISTGRDSTYAVHRIIMCNEQAQLETVHQLALPFGPNIEGMDYTADGHIWIWGFRSKEFVVYDIQLQREVMVVECGGAHRSWAFQMKAQGGNFVWTKASKLYYQIQTTLPFHNISSGGHGREIKAVAIHPWQPDLIATGAEDTNIKLSTYMHGGFRCMHTLRKHNTGIQHLQWSSDGRYLFSSGGFEEFFVWRATPDILNIGIGVVCESTNPRSGRSDLRITSFVVEEVEASSTEAARFRIMMAYSDSSVRSWLYGAGNWSLLASGHYLTSCLTQCVKLDEDPARFLLTSTDGHLSHWILDPSEQQLRWNSRFALHQNAVLSLATCVLSDSSLLIISGGDDNAITITRFAKGRIAAPNQDALTLNIRRAHAAAVTGIVMVSHLSDHDRMWVVSAGLDQHARLWQINVDVTQPGVEGVDVQRLASVFTCVADVSCIALMPAAEGLQPGVLLCGVGMDMWRVTV